MNREIVHDPLFLGLRSETVTEAEQQAVMDVMMDLQDTRGLTYMFITHDMSVVRHISQEIVVM